MLHGILRIDRDDNTLKTWIDVYHLGGRLEVAGLQIDALRMMNKLPIRSISSRVSFWKAWKKAEHGSLLRRYLSVRLGLHRIQF